MTSIVNLPDSKIDEMCEVITNCDLRGDDLVEYVKGFIFELKNPSLTALNGDCIHGTQLGKPCFDCANEFPF